MPPGDPGRNWVDEMHDRWMHAQYLIEDEGKSIEQAAEESLMSPDDLREMIAVTPGMELPDEDES